MSASDLALTFAGVAILAISLADVFLTVLHHWGREGRLNRTLVRSFWRAALTLSRGLSGEKRRKFLGLVGPVLIPVVVGVWAALVIVGFALLYLPWMSAQYQAGTSVPSPFSLGDALYYSGVTFFTLGYGDLVPEATSLRALAVMQAGAGFALITLVISYFTSVYGAYTQQKVAAASVYYQSGETADAARFIAGHLQAGASTAVIARELASLRDSLARIRSDYADYPILNYFRSSRAEQSLLRLLFVAHDLPLLLDTAIDSTERPELAELGRRSGVRYAAIAARGRLADALLRKGWPDLQRHAEHHPADEQHSKERFACALGVLRGSGVPVRESGQAAREYCQARGEWEPVMRACAASLGEDWAEVSGGY